jgi:hypothetical protein
MCRVMKPLTAFPIKDRVRGTLRSYCWMCCRIYARTHYRLNRDAYLVRTRKRHKRNREACRRFVREYLSTHPCVDCGETDPVVLDCDHRDRTTKTADVNRLIGVGDVEKVRLEIAKCDVRCANCHRQRTALQLGWARLRSQDE